MLRIRHFLPQPELFYRIGIRAERSLETLQCLVVIVKSSGKDLSGGGIKEVKWVEKENRS